MRYLFMKKFLFIFTLFVIYSAPAFSDVLNPHITSEEYRKIRQERQIYRQRIAFVERVCGDDFAGDKYCKTKLKKEIKEIEKLVK